MVNVIFTGKLARIVGMAKWKLDVKSPAEALHAVDVNTRGRLFNYLRGEGGKKYYKVAVQRKDNLLSKDEIKNPSGSGDIYIMPTIAAAGDNAWAKIIIGIILVVVSIYTFGAGAAAFGGVFGSGAAGATAAGAFAGGLLSAGLSLVLGGVTQLMTPTPEFNDKTGEQINGTTFQGNATTISQGGGVPIAYGRVLISPMPISISVASYDQAAPDAEIGSVETTELDGGGQEYS